MLENRVLPQPHLLSWVQETSGQPVTRCYQCYKCTGGCPVAAFMDILPHQIIRYLNLGLEEELLKSKAIWLCASCHTCKARCPNGIDIAGVNDALKARVLSRGVPPASPMVAAFHQEFLASVERYGRVHELGLVMAYKLKSRDYWKDLSLGLKMFRKGKFRLWPHRVQKKEELQAIFKRARGEA
ncbi:heterodisulfide reductase subunit C [Thermanaeromonas toyohensis ToBE]|uniref:Heterodisulfide reductase subunit C n=1 Tax=Thermanaeromonas toyohensis ToBE TaxID=698762 RepID=A0A1W1VXH9_9FIRM|nr:4Fe-4S dicluster domain-containing protein [Thermanaeromonas toyohensis]SMB98089.1 heterodisulfide reductase subunit C [Thermanaeromonas toyohensis ToBE]